MVLVRLQSLDVSKLFKDMCNDAIRVGESRLYLSSKSRSLPDRSSVDESAKSGDHAR